jgi:hypothetical protein
MSPLPDDPAAPVEPATAVVAVDAAFFELLQAAANSATPIPTMSRCRH